MSHTVKFPFTPTLQSALETARNDPAAPPAVLIVRIVTETIDLDRTYQTASEFRHSDPKPPYFVLSRAPDAPGKWTLLAHVPDTCPPKERMLSASCAGHIKKECGLNVTREVRVADPEDVMETFQSLQSAPPEKKAEKSSTHDDHIIHAENMAPRPMGFSHGIVVAVRDSAKDAIKRLVESRSGNLTLRIEKDELFVDEKGLTETAPAFHIAYASESEMKCFFLCPSGCKVKDRMVHASSKASVMEHFNALGCVYEKCIECGEISDITEALQGSGSAGGEAKGPASPPAAPGAPTAPRPKRPGKGPAMLIE